MLRLYPIVCKGPGILYIVFIYFIASCKHAIFREAYIEKRSGGLDEKIKLSNVLVKRRKALLDQVTISTEIYCVSNSTSGKTLIIYVRYWKLSAVYCSLVDYLQLSLGSITPP